MKSIAVLSILFSVVSNPAWAQTLCGTVGEGDGAVMLQVGVRPTEILGPFQLLQELRNLEGQYVCVEGEWKADNSAFIANTKE